MTVTLARGRALERALELADELGAHVVRGELIVAGGPQSVVSFAGALEHAGFKLGAEASLPAAAAGVPLREWVAERDGLVLRLRTV